jgi:PAS domain S-box-containing protein
MHIIKQPDPHAILPTNGLEDIIASSEDAILTKDLHGIITSWNPGAEKLFGYTALEAIGQPMLAMFPAERMAEESGILARIARGERIDHFETVRLTRDGRRLDVSVSLSPLRDGNGTVVGASKIVRDISGRKRAEEHFLAVIEGERRQATSRLQSQLGWLALLRRVTHAIGQRHDLPSILQVVVASLEDCLPIELA